MYFIRNLVHQSHLASGIFILLVMADACFLVNVLSKYFLFRKCANKIQGIGRLLAPLSFSKICHLDKTSLVAAVRLNMAVKIFAAFILLTAITAFFMVLIFKQGT